MAKISKTETMRNVESIENNDIRIEWKKILNPSLLAFEPLWFRMCSATSKITSNPNTKKKIRNDCVNTLNTKLNNIDL